MTRQEDQKAIDKINKEIKDMNTKDTLASHIRADFMRKDNDRTTYSYARVEPKERFSVVEALRKYGMKRKMNIIYSKIKQIRVLLMLREKNKKLEKKCRQLQERCVEDIGTFAEMKLRMAQQERIIIMWRDAAMCYMAHYKNMAELLKISTDGLNKLYDTLQIPNRKDL